MDKRMCWKDSQIFSDQYDVLYIIWVSCKRRTTPNSDVDIAVLFVQGLSLLRRFEEWRYKCLSR